MYLPFIPPTAALTRLPALIRGIARALPLTVVSLLALASVGFAQTQVGTLNVNNPTFLAIDTDASGTRWLYVANHGDVGGSTGGIVWNSRRAVH